MYIDITVLITLLFGLFSFFAYVGTQLVNLAVTLTELKVSMADLKKNQEQIIEDIKIIENKVFE